MQTLHRTTITIPKDVYKHARIRAAYGNKSLSKFISDMLAHAIITEKAEKKPPPLPLGAYSFNEKGRETYRREKMYETHIRRKIPR